MRTQRIDLIFKSLDLKYGLRDKSVKLLMVIIAHLALVGCGSYQNGTATTQDDYGYDAGQDWASHLPNAVDQQAFQANFMTLNVNQLSYVWAMGASTVNLSGQCFNPGFTTVSIYYRVFDSDNEWIYKTDGQPYGTNRIYYSGSDQLQVSNMACSQQGHWNASFQMPTTLLAQLDGGYIEMMIVAKYNNQDLYNVSASVARPKIHVPDWVTSALSNVSAVTTASMGL